MVGDVNHSNWICCASDYMPIFTSMLLKKQKSDWVFR